MNNYDEIQRVKRLILAEKKYYKGRQLPEPQRVGTSIQRTTCALLSAQKFVEELYEA